MSSPDQQLARLLDDPAGYLGHRDPAIRRLAVTLVAERREAGLLEPMLDDPEPMVRAAAVEALGRLGTEHDTIMAATNDPDERVVEAAATALGELGDPAAVGWLTEAARTNADKLVREAAVAALGAIGHRDAVPVLLELLESGPPQVRRRCVVALTVFDAPQIEPALRAALDDRNPMVREAAEMVVGRPVEPPPPVPIQLTRKQP